MKILLINDGLFFVTCSFVIASTFHDNEAVDHAKLHNLFSCLYCPGAFTKNVVAAAPVVYCKRVLDNSTTVGSSKNRAWIVLFIHKLLCSI